jgi:hypothetical protein
VGFVQPRGRALRAGTACALTLVVCEALAKPAKLLDPFPGAPRAVYLPRTGHGELRTTSELCSIIRSLDCAPRERDEYDCSERNAAPPMAFGQLGIDNG